MATDPASLLKSSQCAACYGNSVATVKLMKLALLVQLVTGNTMATDPASLLSQASCFACYGSNELSLELMELALLQQLVISGGGGSSSGLNCANYGGGQPPFTPATACAQALDTSSGRVWYYYNGAWH